MVDFSKLLKKNRNGSGKYAKLRLACLAGLILLSFFAITQFPVYYEDGPTLREWVMIVFVMLSADVLLYIERASSNQSGRRPHDPASSGGSLHAFSFSTLFCKKCGARLALGYVGKSGKPVFITPGAAAPEDAQTEYFCPHCAKAVTEEAAEKRQFASSKLKSSRLRELGKDFHAGEGYKLSPEYTKRYVFIVAILLLGEISCFWFARSSAIKLILPLAVGYFLFTALYNAALSLRTRYYVTADGVIQRGLWGYSMYEVTGSSSLIKFEGQQGTDAWGLYTEKENLMISPIIAGYKDMISALKDVCRQKNVCIVER